MIKMSLVPSPSWGVAFGVGFVIASSFDIHWFLRLAYTRYSCGPISKLTVFRPLPENGTFQVIFGLQ
jgi:hypothetical protein